MTTTIACGRCGYETSWQEGSYSGERAERDEHTCNPTDVARKQASDALNQANSLKRAEARKAFIDSLSSVTKVNLVLASHGYTGKRHIVSKVIEQTDTTKWRERYTVTTRYGKRIANRNMAKDIVLEIWKYDSPNSICIKCT